MASRITETLMDVAGISSTTAVHTTVVTAPYTSRLPKRTLVVGRMATIKVLIFAAKET